MNIRSRTRKSLSKMKVVPTKFRLVRLKIFSALILTIMLIVNALPAGAVSTPFNPNHGLDLQTASTLTFVANADTYVEELHPAANNGTLDYLQVESANNRNTESYIRFTVNGVTGTVQSARLRVFTTVNSSTNGPALYTTGNTWTETGLTWNNRPARTSGVIDNKGAIDKNTWVEYNVAPVVTSNGTFNLVLVGDSSDEIRFSAREGSNPPQLVIIFASSTPTATVASSRTSTPTARSSTSTTTRTPTRTATLPSGATSTPTRTPTNAKLATATLTRTPTRTPTSASNPTQTPTRTPTRTPTSASNPTATPTRTATASSGDAVLVGAGDISTCSNNNDEATAKLLDSISGTVFNAGDNAYDSGTLSEYTNCYDPTWGRHKARTKPSPGNHEYQTSGASGYFQYFNNVPSYYAYNLGTWRIYSLNSEIDVSASGAQGTWLQSDLAANPKACVLAYWHKPRWSSGSTHGSTSEMQAIWQILYNAGAEVVVNGHEHNYERFAQMNASGSTVSQGLREFVVGTGGVGHYGFGSVLSSSQVRNSSTFGVLKLTLHSGSYDWQFVPIAGSTFTDSGSANCH